jgi:hypothetical protein
LQLTQNLFELSNAHALDNVATETNDCIFTVDYDKYDNSIKSAKLKINDQQEVDLDYIKDNSGIVPKYYVRLSNIDNLYNVSIDLIMDSAAIADYITIIRDFARKMYSLNSITNTTN